MMTPRAQADARVATTRTAEQWAGVVPKAIADTCSQTHIAFLIADAQRDIAALFAALAATARAEARWQPIETAPLGTDILLWCEGSKYEDRGVKVGQMTTLTGRRVPLIGDTLYTTSGDAFTHWQPLPAAPSAAAILAQTPDGETK